MMQENFSMPSGYEFHVISNTHWDREWRHPSQETRTHLIALMDWLFEIFEKYPDYKHYHLDSQTIPLEDYLEIRPENEDKLKKYISEGRLLVGPWYTLPEMNTVSGEAVLRNLLRGNKIASKFGRVMKIGYTPTSYGQLSQIAQIYAGFGIDGMMFYRGIVRQQCDTEYILESPDGTRILGLRLSALFSRASFWFHLFRQTMFADAEDDGTYEWRKGMAPFRRCDTAAGDHDYRLLQPTMLDHFNTSRLDQGMKNIKADVAADATTPYLIVMDGMDSVFPHPNTIRIIDYCNSKNTGDTYIHSSFPAVIDKIKKNVDWSKLTVLKGERRHPSRDDWFNRLLKDQMSTRLYQKQINARVQTLLEKWAEPLSVYTTMLGSEYPAPYLELAWKYLLTNHPHDSITGVSMDQIHKDMLFRWDQVEQIGESLTNRGMSTLAKKIDLSSYAEKDIAVMAFNPLNYERSEIVDVEIDFPDKPAHKSMEIIDADTGENVPFQLISRKNWGSMVMNPYDICTPFYSRRFRIAFEAGVVPPSGYRTFIVRSKEAELANHGSMLTANNTMENSHLRVAFNSNGTFDLTKKSTQRTFRNCHFFEDDAEAGDPWTRISPPRNRLVSSLGCQADISVVEDGELRTTFKVDITMRIPKSLNPGKQSRSEDLVPLPITSYITLTKDSPRLDITTTFDNNAMDHRLRVCFPSDVSSDTVDAEVAFDVVTRELELPDTRDWVEPWTGTQPHLSFFDMSDDKGGLAVISHGLVEYEVQNNTPRTMILTLLKGLRYPKVGLPAERVERMEQTGSQCPGTHTSSYALYPHEGDWQQGRVHEWSYRFFTPLKLAQFGPSPGSLPASMSFVNVEPKELVLSAVKQCEQRDTVIVRFFNPTESELKGKIRFFKPVGKAWLTNLNEERQDELEPDADGAVAIKVGKKKIITCELQF